MSRIATTIKTNTPFTVHEPSMLFMIPENVVIDLFASVDGINYEDISGRMYGEQLCSVTFIPCTTWFKLISDSNVKISILK